MKNLLYKTINIIVQEYGNISGIISGNNNSQTLVNQ